MGFHLPHILIATLAANQASSKAVDMPKGFLVIYVGERTKLFAIPISYLNQPSLQDLLSQSKDEFGNDHSMDGVTIPCSKNVFQHIDYRLSGL